MDIKTEIPDTDDDYLKQQTSLESSVESKSEAGNGAVRTYIIRPLDASRAALKRSIQDRDGSLTVKSECIDVESGRILSESPQTRNVVRTASISEGGVKFWRTASGKLLRLDPASPHPLIVRDSIGELASSKPRLVRLANGRLARITKKRIPASLLHQRTASVANSNQFHASIQRFPVPSATASVAVSDAIDASSLMGNGAESTELFEVQKKEPSPAIKAEPVDEKELEEQQEQSSLPPPTSEALNTLRTPSLAAALCDVNTAPTNVSDLVKIVDEPLFNPTRYNNNSSSDHCNVCKKVLPGMKRHLITVEARLTCLVDAVQNLIVQMNPKDLEAAQAAAKAASAIQAANSNPQEHSRCCSSYRAKEANSISESRKTTQERPSAKLTIPRPKPDNQSGPPTQAVKRPSILRPGIVRIIRTTPTSPSDAVQPGSVTASPRFVLGKTRFVVADRAQTSRTVFAGNEAAGSGLKVATLKSETGAKDATS